MSELKSFYAIVEPSPASADEASLGIWFPDLPGCVSLAADWNAVPSRAEEALGLHLAGMALDGEPIPSPRTRMDLVKLLEDYVGSSLERVTVDLESEVAQARERRGKAERINITVQAKELMIVDELSEKLGLTRSAYFRRSALTLPPLLRALDALSKSDPALNFLEYPSAIQTEDVQRTEASETLRRYVATVIQALETFRPLLETEPTSSGEHEDSPQEPGRR